MFYCYLADGFEEMEAIAPIDILRRSGVEVITVGVTGNNPEGAHGISVKADISLKDAVFSDELEGIILPGGLKGTLNLESTPEVQSAIEFALENDKFICAICAAPQILGHKGILRGKQAIAYPGFECELEGAVISEKYVVRDGNIITAKGAGVALEFGLEIVSAVSGKSKSDEIKSAIQMI